MAEALPPKRQKPSPDSPPTDTAPPPPSATRPFRNIQVTVHCSILPPCTVHYTFTAQHSTRSQRRADARQRKFDHLHSTRHTRRQQHKERARQRKRKAHEDDAAEAEQADAAHPHDSPPVPPALRGKRLRASVVERSLRAPRVVVDLSYEALMAEPDVHSLAKQLRFLYADNTHAQHPMQLVLSSLGPLTHDHAKQGEEPSTDDSSAAEASEAGEREEGEGAIAAPRLYDCLRKNAGFHSWALTAFPHHFLLLPPSPSPSPSPSPPPPPFVYLTAESSTLLTSLHPFTTYVIGGLVDHNRLKGHTHAAAIALSIPTARLPLTECMQVKGGRRTVITVNQAYQCLLQWWQAEAEAHAQQGEHEHAAHDESWQRRWCAVFKHVLPSRQGWQVRPEFADEAELPSTGIHSAG